MTCKTNTSVIGISNTPTNGGAQVRRIAVDYRGWVDHFPVVILKATAHLSKMSPSISCLGISGIEAMSLLGHHHGGQDNPLARI